MYKPNPLQNNFEKDTDTLYTEIRQLTKAESYFDANKDELIVPNPLKYLLEIATQKNISKADVIQASGLERTYGYHILDGTKGLTRDKALCLAIGGQLTLEEVQQLLKYAGLSQLYPRNRRDGMLIFAFSKGYDLDAVNNLLADAKLEPLK